MDEDSDQPDRPKRYDDRTCHIDCLLRAADWNSCVVYPHGSA